MVDTGWSRMKIMIGEINGMIMEMGREYKGVLKGVGEERGEGVEGSSIFMFSDWKLFLWISNSK